jgi:glutathione synthase/RimK-type ligase-like ATP-grasp enzyme
LLVKAKLAAPKTLVAHKYNIDAIDEQLGFPCVLKQPDSSSSLGVVKVKNKEELIKELAELFSHSELIIAQEFTPTEFDWRIGVLDRKPLYAVKYYMVKNHWQICDWNGDNKPREGKHEGVPLEDVPPQVIHTAVKAANLIGDGLYGVDLKQVGKKTLVIEVNDNPSIEHGVEDAVLKDELYLTIMKSLMHRVQNSKMRKTNL